MEKKTPWVTIVIVVFAIVVAAGWLAGRGDDEGGTAPRGPAGQPQDSRQEAYNRFLRQARQDVASDPDLSCDFDFQDLVIDNIQRDTGATDAEVVLIRYAMGDACTEAGEWEGGNYSPYHGGAP